ncbi:MAG: UDP-N-acetylglucosamine 1-carboxyvinyltransferase [Clostridia bacterium]|nr:UDP-N-acetylglucosamine 1-carboxyvinyltransferase [Clostridia bacterium]
MAKLYIEGGKRLTGKIKLQGAKNSALPLLAASMLVDGTTLLHNCPNLSDVSAAIRILDSLGYKCTQTGNDVFVKASMPLCDCVSPELMQEMRSSVVFLGAILARCGSATVTTPGGCELGPRPIDIHLKAIQELGFSVEENGGYICCKRVNMPKEVDITLDFASVGATENVILASCISGSTVYLHNAAKEPEIKDLADFLNKAGAKIYGAGTDTVTIIGVEKINSVEHTVIPDRIVAATYMSAAAVTGGDIEITNINCEHMRRIIASYSEMGCDIVFCENSLRIRAPEKLRRIKATRSTVYPGFPTDAGPLLVASLVKASGTSTFVETIFENRFNYIDELRRLGADIKVYNRVAIVEGVSKLNAANLCCTDLRGGAAEVVLALAADGITSIDKIHHIERGYEKIEETLSGVFANIKKE